MRLAALAFVVGSACQPSQNHVVTDTEAAAFATKLVPLLKPCDEAKLASLSEVPLCTEMRGSDEIKLVRVHAVNGELRPVLRKLARDTRTGATFVAYDDLVLRKTDGVRVVDVFSYLQGQSIKAELPAAAREARELQRQGKNAVALTLIDALSKEQREARGVQLLRVRAAAGVGPTEYKEALAELAKVFSDDPSVAAVQIDGAFTLRDWDAALKWIDLLDRAIGGDAMLDARRAVAHLQRADFSSARTAADKATTAEPTLRHAWEVKLDIALAQKQWSDAVSVMTVLEDKFGGDFGVVKLASQPQFLELIASNEYKEWRAGRTR